VRAASSVFHVADDFLPAPDFLALRTEARQAPLVDAKLVSFRGALQRWDGSVEMGAAHEVPARRLGEQASALSGFLARLSEHAAHDELIRSLVGAPDVAWQRISARYYFFGPGSGLSWHTDAPGRTGSFAYYVHESWRPHWGGMLLIGRRKWASPVGDERSFLDAAEAEEWESGAFLAPLPNRLVVIRSGVPHSVAPLTGAAGDRFRISLSGFFLTS
jgi:Rps23 Pro-64 3,4-dihydroxylase Tpa1-like proline 4-hydroxylase